MNETSILDAVMEEVLETMFFSSTLRVGESDGPPQGPMLAAAVTFTGPRTGTLVVRAAEPVAVALVSNFLVDNSASHELAGLVLGETANMVCGSLLGRVEPDGHFQITPPRLLDPAEEAGVWENSCIRRYIDADEGRIEIALTLM